MSCPEINARIEQLKREIAAEEADIAAIDNMLNLGDATNGKPLGSRIPIEIKTVNGRIVLDQDTLTQQMLAGMKAANSPGVEAMVRKGIAEDMPPDGSSGRFLNYRNIDMTEENFAKVAEGMAIGKFLADPEGYGVLTRTFTKEEAARMYAGNYLRDHKEPQKLLRELIEAMPHIEKMPERSVRLNLARIDATEEFLSATDAVLEFLADNPESAVNQEMLDGVWRAGKWATVFTEFDAHTARRVGQTLNARRTGTVKSIREVVAGKEIPFSGDPADGFEVRGVAQQTRETVKPGSLVSEVMRLVDEGDIAGLKNLITTARSVESKKLFDPKMDWRKLRAIQMSALTSDGILSGIATLAVNNPVSGIGMFLGDSWRMVNEDALRVGYGRSLQSMFESYQLMLSTAGQGFKLARDHYTTGKTLQEMDLGRVNMSGTRSLTDEEQRYLIDSLLTQEGKGVPAMLSKSYAAWRLMLHELTNKAPDLPSLPDPSSRAGQALNAGIDTINTVKRWPLLPAHRMLGAQDELIRWGAYKVAVHHKARVKAYEVLGRDAPKSEIDAFVKAEVGRAYLGDEVTIDDVNQFRLTRGIPRTQMTDSQIMELLANDYAGAPSLKTEISQEAQEFARAVVGQDDFGAGIVGSASRAMEQVRYNHPVMRFVLPIFRTPLRMTQRMFGTAFPIVPMAQLADDIVERMVKGNTDRVIRGKSLASVIVSLQAWSVFTGLQAAGLIRGGGPHNREERELWLKNNRPYSLGPANNKGAQMQLNNVDPFGVLFMWADILDLWKEGAASDLDANSGIELAVEGVARTIRERNAIRNVSTLFEIATSPLSKGQGGSAERLLGSIAGQFIPNVANFRDVNRFIGPEQRYARDRDISSAEMKFLRDSDRVKDARIDWIKNRLGEITRAAMPLAGIAMGSRTEKDWLGTDNYRSPLLRADAFLRFVPTQGAKFSPVHDWLFKNNVRSKPRASGDLEGITMWDDLEDLYRETMFTVVPTEEQRPTIRFGSGDMGKQPSLNITFAKVVPMLNADGVVVGHKTSHTEQVPASRILDEVTKGNNLYDALNALRNHPQVQMLEKNQSLSSMAGDRSPADEQRSPVNQLIKLVVSYYDQLTLDSLRRSGNPDAERWRAEQLVLMTDQTAAKTQGAVGGVVDLLRFKDYNLGDSESSDPLEVLQLQK